MVANRWATGSFWFARTGDGRDVFVGLGSLRDSTDESVTRFAANFQSSPLQVPPLNPVLAGYLVSYPAGP